MASDADSDNDNEMGIDSDDSDVEEEEEENRRLQQEQQQRSTRSFFPGRRGEGEGEEVGGELKRPSSTATSGSPLVCLVNLAGDSAAGAAVGSFFGYASGLIKKKGVRGSFGDAGTSAKTFAVLAGVHGLVVCFLKNLRKKDDAINAGIAGCCTGLALSFPGAPQVLLQSCLTFGAFSSIIEGLNKKQPALAHVSSIDNVNTKGMQADVLPPFTLPLPHDLLEGFSSFCKSLPNFKRAS